MAIIHCHECSKDLSDTATTCPNCGCKTKFSTLQDNEKIKQRRIILGLIGLCIIFFVGRSLYINKQNQDFINSGAAATAEEVLRSMQELNEQHKKTLDK